MIGIAWFERQIGADLVPFAGGVDQAGLPSIFQRVANVRSLVGVRVIRVVASNGRIIRDGIGAGELRWFAGLGRPQHGFVVAAGEDAIAGALESVRHRVVGAVAQH